MNISEEKIEGPVIETIKNVTKTVPIIISERDNLLDENASSINLVRNQSNTKFVPKVYE